MHYLPVYPHELWPQIGIFPAPQTVSSPPLTLAPSVSHLPQCSVLSLCLRFIFLRAQLQGCLLSGLPQGLSLLGSLFSFHGHWLSGWELIVVFAVQFQAALCLLPFQASSAELPTQREGRQGNLADHVRVWMRGSLQPAWEHVPHDTTILVLIKHPQRKRRNM